MAAATGSGDGQASVYWPLFGLGLVFLLAAVLEACYALFVSNPLGGVWLVGFLTSLPFILGVTYVGYWLPRSSLSPPRYSRVFSWCLGALALFGLLNLTLMIPQAPRSTLEFMSWVRWVVTLGAGAGVTIGVYEARGIERAVEAERTRVRATEAEAREQLLSYLNALLQHEIRNTTSVIQGNAELLSRNLDADSETADRLDTIMTYTRDMEQVIEDVQVLLEAFDEDATLDAIEVTDLLERELETLASTDNALEVELSVPDTATVAANEALRRAIRNVLANAVDHNESETPRIAVDVEPTAETVRIRIADNGPGIPPAEHESLFERDGPRDADHGLGLSLSRTLIERFHGTLELTDTGPDGTVVTIELPAAKAAETAELAEA